MGGPNAPGLAAAASVTAEIAIAAPERTRAEGVVAREPVHASDAVSRTDELALRAASARPEGHAVAGAFDSQEAVRRFLRAQAAMDGGFPQAGSPSYPAARAALPELGASPAGPAETGDGGPIDAAAGGTGQPGGRFWQSWNGLERFVFVAGVASAGLLGALIVLL
jgi:hypothetical protein